ncbi:perilipin-3-like [Rhineura floridana]|uniref:perilipin-3-like n=1 Tax=Rhineura floridana TaxID=261503 RepID=UPI002AC7F3A4|nr:perilipin-3-like [Rhineura floridana]XP_061494500.1 perilipin-3-like [Rhineura floridana]XP_061494501.1 perilipin-3-like [Rhineura floridana]XP_061494502.1 perilipin-3-like [Rhineura floridana]
MTSKSGEESIPAPESQKESVPAPESKEVVQQDVLKRATSLPLVSSTYGLAASAYASTKENHPYVKAVLDLAEKGVKHVSDIAVSGAQPLLNKLEPQVAVASRYASKGLDKLEEKLPILHQTADQVLSDTQELVSSKVAGAKEAVAKAVQDGKEMVVEMKMGKMALSGAEAVLEKSEELLNHYLPMTEEELAKVAESTPEGVHTTPETRGYFVRLGSLSTKLQHRAYQYAVTKIKAARDNITEIFIQLRQAIGQIEDTKQSVHQKLQESQDRLRQIESQTLAMSYHITQQLQMAYKNLIASIQGLPANFQQNIQLAYRNIEELHAYFTKAHSFKDLSNSVLSQSKEKALKAQEYVDDILDYVVHNAPLSWLVGPFAPSPKKPSDVVGTTEPND